MVKLILTMTMGNISPYAWSWSKIFDHDHGENLNVSWSWSMLYPPPNLGICENAINYTFQIQMVRKGNDNVFDDNIQLGARSKDAFQRYLLNNTIENNVKML